MGYSVAILPSEPSRCAARRARRPFWELQRDGELLRRATSSTLAGANGLRCRRPTPEWLCLRPLSGAEADAQLLHPALEREPVRPARFDLSTIGRASQRRTRPGFCRDALRLSLRRGAGPFRSAARLAFEPRAYQLVPLLMALRLPTVRLLIADDVGIGKTIEAGLILRELIDRGEVDRFAVLCPPHLVEQWTGELKSKFDLDAVAVTASSAARLERGLPASQTLFDAHPFTVVSLDYIKADKRRDSFARACPGLGDRRRGARLRRHAS